MKNSITVPTYYYRVKVVKSITLSNRNAETIISTHTPMECGKQYFGLPGYRNDHAVGVGNSPYRWMDENYKFHEERIKAVQLEGSSKDKDDHSRGVAVDVIEVIRLERSFILMSNLTYNSENREQYFISDTYNPDEIDIHAKVWELSGKKVITNSTDYLNIVSKELS